MEITGLNHITFAVSDMDRSVEFYAKVLKARLLCRSEGVAYFELAGIWLALNLGESNPSRGYTHIAFSISEEHFSDWQQHLLGQGVELRSDRNRHADEGKSLYFQDPDGHLLELHTKSRHDRVKHYRKTRGDMDFF